MFLRRSSRRCDLFFLTIWASICCFACAGPSISPTFSLLGHATTFRITDVQYPYIICSTEFPDSDKQAVYAKVTNRDTQGERAASCVVDAPGLPSGLHSVDAHIRIRGAPGPRGILQDGDEYLMQFIQPPTVVHSDLLYQDNDQAGYRIRVFLEGANGMKKVKDRINAALKLELDMSVIGENTVSLPGSVSFSKDVATATFRLPQMLPNGRYPCVLSISGHPVRLNESHPDDEDESLQTRAQDRFNSSDSAQVLPLTQPVASHTFIVSVSAPSVLLAPSSMSASDLIQCGDDEDDTEGCLNAIDTPTADMSQLWLSLKGQQVHGHVSVLLSMTVGNASVNEATILSAVKDRDILSTTDDVVMLPLPSIEEAGVSLLWVQWDDSTARARRLLFEMSDVPFPEDGCFVRIFRAISATVDLSLQSTWIAPPERVLPVAPPEFFVQGLLVAHRGDNVTFHVGRCGPPSEQESRVLWRLVYLDPASDSELPIGVGGMLDVGTRPGTGVDALNRAGTLHWLPGDSRDLVTVTVPVAWGVVPYSARWMLAVRLAARQNGAVASGEFVPPRAPLPRQAAPAAAPSQQLTDQLNGFTPAVAGDTDWEAAAVHAIVYGVRDGACPPSTGRVGGTVRSPPVVNGLSSSHTIRGISLQVSTHKDSVSGGEQQFVQTAPPFGGPEGTLTALVPHDMPHAAITVSALRREAVLMHGCGTSEPAAAPQRWNSSTVSDTTNHLWHLQRPENSSSCTAVLRSCAGTASDTQTCLRGDRSDKVRVRWLDDASLARIDSVNVTIGGDTWEACGSGGSGRAYMYRNATVPGTGSSAEEVIMEECRPHAFVNTSLVYHRGETIKIAVQPVQSGRVASVSIGQRVFRADSQGELGRVSVAFRLFDASDRLSPFVPFVIRQRTRDRTVLDVPIMLTLADGITAVPFTLLLDITVRPRRPAPLPVPPHATTPVVRSSGSEGIPVSVEVVAESGHVSFLTNGVATAEAPIDVTASHPGSRRLLDVSTAAPEGQAWLDDPLKNEQCEACPEGFFSDNMDVLCQRCQPGSCAPYQSMTACSTCPQGSYAPVHGASSCLPCVHGSYAQLPGATACRLCPFGYTTKSDGAVVCDQAVEQTVAVGKEYALAVSFSVRLMGMSFDDVPQRTGVLGSPENILQFLVSLDSAAAFRVSTADVQVSSMTEVKPRMLRINVTTNIAIDAPKKASKEELERAVTLAQLSKDAGIGNLTWDHTTEALGGSAVTEDKVETEILQPERERRVSWQAIVMPIIAGIIILGSLFCLRVQRSRDHGLDNATQTPALLIAQALGAVRAAMCPTSRRSEHRFSNLSSEVTSDPSDNLHVDMHPRESGKRISSMSCTDGIELNPRTGTETRKRPVVEFDN
eukprot:jgi/Ulvmu1/10473/UM064_0010.1